MSSMLQLVRNPFSMKNRKIVKDNSQMFRTVPEQNFGPEQEIANNHAGCAAVPA